MPLLSSINGFGDVAAENDAVLEYFLATQAVEAVASGSILTVLGRKGTGKTAIVRYFTEREGHDRARSLNLRGYPWNVHAARVDHGASEVEAYVSAWRYLLSVELASIALAQPLAYRTSTAQALTNFLEDNYGGTSPALSDILRPARLKLSKVSFVPAVMGNQLGGIEMDRAGGDLKFGLELSALSKSIIDAAFTCLRECSAGTVSLHFDELDQGIGTIDQQRRTMLIGLILAARDLKRDAERAKVAVNPIIYLRSDLWDELKFSDKNKITQSSAFTLEWNSESLLKLIELRLNAKLGVETNWDSIAEPALMRGSQSKWSHILARTFLRPRDVISFLNFALIAAVARDKEATAFKNEDIQRSRERFSYYLQAELDDEIGPHWQQWMEALQACSAIGTVSFQRDDFAKEYGNRKSAENPVNADDALALLFRFSVIGYRVGIGGGGSSWIFQYTDPASGWDSVAKLFKVHPGLKEFAKLREARTQGGSDWDEDVAATWSQLTLSASSSFGSVFEKFLTSQIQNGSEAGISSAEPVPNGKQEEEK